MARVGPRQLTVPDVERRLAALPDYQRRALSATEPDVARMVVEQVLVPELLFAAEADRRKLAETPTGRARVTAVLERALLEQLRADVVAKEPVTAEQVRAYYEKHHAEFNTPAAIRIWRILVDREQLARDIIAKVQDTDGPLKWSELAREHSKDRATRMRKGDLGFVRPDGKTDVPRVQVDPHLYEVASQVQDGELLPEPIAEGGHFAVVWRRGSRPAREQSVDEARQWIEATLSRVRHERAVQALTDKLEREYVTDFDATPLAELDALPVRELRQLPLPVLSARAARQRPAPRPSDRGLR